MLVCSPSMHATLLPWEKSTNHMPRKRVVTTSICFVISRPGADWLAARGLGTADLIGSQLAKDYCVSEVPTINGK